MTYQNSKIVKNNNFSDLKSLPADTGGTHSAHILGETDAPYGFYIYIPAGYEQSSVRYPLLVFHHGDGEQGNSTKDAWGRIARLTSQLVPRWYSRSPPTRGKLMKRIFSVRNWPIFRSPLDLVLEHGPPHLIHNSKWTPTYPMIVVSPQCHYEKWQADKIDEFIRYIVKNYRVNQSRIYMTGLSGGGDGVYRYLAEMGNRSLVAAAVAICGEGTAAQAKKARVPIWIFHTEFDDVVPLQTAIEMKEGFTNVPEVKLTVYPDMEHGGWGNTYDLTGMGKGSGKYDPYDISIYDWLLTYSLSENGE
ncbi:dienelactone hydrolase family protein [Thermodesulfobacteriota bacterium]